MKRDIPYHRLWILPALLVAFLIQAACDETGPGAADSAAQTGTVALNPDTARPVIPKPAPDATITDSLTHDFSGVWTAAAGSVNDANVNGEGIISFCREGAVRYRVYRDGPTLFFRAKQVWIDRQHVHVDLFLTRMERGSAAIADSLIPGPSKLFGTADLTGSEKMSVLWYARDLVSAVRTLGNANRPEAFASTFYYTKLSADCQ